MMCKNKICSVIVYKNKICLAKIYDKIGIKYGIKLQVGIFCQRLCSGGEGWVFSVLALALPPCRPRVKAAGRAPTLDDEHAR